MVEYRPERETRSIIPIASASHDLTSEERRILMEDRKDRRLIDEALAEPAVVRYEEFRRDELGLE